MAQLKNKVAVVTGAASGLGLGIAARFVAEGASVMLTDIDLEGGAKSAARLGERARFIGHNVSSDDDWRAVIAATEEAFGTLDVLVNNAGITLMGSVEDISLEAFDRSFDINVRGVFLGCRHAITAMKARRSGSIINIASVSSFKPMPELVAYNGSKAAVALMTKSIALHCAQTGTGVRCNSINPGVVRTAMLDKVMAQVPNPEELMNGYIAMHPIGRVGEPEDIAAMAVFLAGDESGFVTGSAFTVDGGLGL
jgi:NAD(P)-dependent dehydrogenase (short-subunit alcohol dehydrogenase family)